MEYPLPESGAMLNEQPSIVQDEASRTTARNGRFRTKSRILFVLLPNSVARAGTAIRARQHNSNCVDDSMLGGIEQNTRGQPQTNYEWRSSTLCARTSP